MKYKYIQLQQQELNRLIIASVEEPVEKLKAHATAHGTVKVYHL